MGAGASAPRPVATMETEYYEPKLLKGEKAKPSILIDADRILELLLRADPMMTKTDRRRYGDLAIRQIQVVIEKFYLAYDFEEDRLFHLKEMWSAITSFIHTMRIIGKVNAISIQPKFETMTPHELKVELVRRIASLDEGATTWKKSITKASRRPGTTPAGNGAGAGIQDNKGGPTCGISAS